MNENKSHDLCRIAGELAEFASLLRTYRLDFLAKKLEFVREFLDSMNQANNTRQGKGRQKPQPHSEAAIIVLQKIRKERQNQQSLCQARSIL
jgi:hypothetical protein